MTKEIFILCPEPPEALGGMETSVREHVVGFQGHGYAVRVFHRGNSGSEFYRRNSRRLSHHLRGTLVGWMVGRAAQKAMHNEVAAVFSHSTVGWYPLRIPPGCKNLHYYHGTYRGQAEAIRPFISYLGYLKLKWWDSMVLERMSGRGKQVFSCSELTRIEVETLFGFQCTTLGSPLDISDFKPRDRQECREKLGLKKDGILGVFVGTTEPNKNFPVIQKLIRELQDVTWVLALRGSSAAAASLSDGDRVQVLTDVPRDRLPYLYAAADFSVCPSRYDPFALVVAEALSCGTPVIASLIGSSRQFLSEPPLSRMVVSKSTDLDGFIDAAKELIGNLNFYREAVERQARPAVQEWMDLDNWWNRLEESTGL
jgi:glycosyltransferase involved in cell wall biosynthesis